MHNFVAGDTPSNQLAEEISDGASKLKFEVGVSCVCPGEMPTGHNGSALGYTVDPHIHVYINAK